MRGFYFLPIALCLIFLKLDGRPPPVQVEAPAPQDTSKTVYDVSVLGAPSTGALVEGVLGSVQKGCRHRFYCHSTEPMQGFLGPQTTAEPLSFRDQPGVFPAPLMGPAALTFCFNCSQENSHFTPIIVRPDGTVFYGQAMSAANSPQTLVIASPAQTGIYNLFILTHQKEDQPAYAVVEASINTQPQERKTFHLKSLEAKEAHPELISAEFTYIPLR